MSDSLHQPPAEIVARALVNPDQYAEMYAASVADPDGVLGRARASGSTGSSPTPGSRTPPSTTTTSRSNGSRTASSTSRPTASTATSPPAPSRPRSSGRATTRTSRGTSPTASCTSRSRSSATCCTPSGVKKGDRVVIYLPMIPEAAYAMLACARIGAVHSIVFAGFSAEALRSRVEDSGAKLVITADEAPRGGRRTPLKANADKALAGPAPACASSSCAAPAAMCPGTASRDVWLHEEMDRVSDHCAAGGDGRRGPALHPLHLRLDRQAQGRGAHHRRLSRLRRDDARVRLRLPRGRRLLVHRGRRLGDRAQLHRLRAAGQRRHHADVRGRADLARRRPLLGRSARSTRSTSSTPPPPRSAR